MIVAVALVSGACAFAAAYLVLLPTRQAWVRARLAPHVRHTASASSRRDPRELAERFLSGTERRLERRRIWRRLESLRLRAGTRLRTVELVYFGATVTLALVLVLGAAGASAISFALAPLAVAGAGCGVLAVKAQRRVKAFDEQLPEVLDSLAASLKSGHSFPQSLRAAALEAREPAAAEFEQALAQLRLGRPLESALEEMAARMGSDDFRFVLTSITIQRQVGGSLASLLETVAETVRRRQQFARKLHALTAMGRMSARVLIVLPAAVAVLLTAINASYMRPLFTTGTGRMLIVVSALMIGLGSLLLKRIVSVKG